MKCSNCSNDANFAVLEEGVSAAYYCNKCLPQSLRVRAEAGQLDIPKPTQTKAKAKADADPEA